MSTLNLSLEKLRETKEDDELFKLLSEALAALFPPEVQSDGDLFLASLAVAPRGLRAMAGIHDLDVSIALYPERCVMQD